MIDSRCIASLSLSLWHRLTALQTAAPTCRIACPPRRHYHHQPVQPTTDEQRDTDRALAGGISWLSFSDCSPRHRAESATDCTSSLLRRRVRDACCRFVACHILCAFFTAVARTKSSFGVLQRGTAAISLTHVSRRERIDIIL